MNSDLDSLLNSDLLKVPEDFSRRVMQVIAPLPPAIRSQSEKKFLQWLAVVAATFMGIEQLAGFIFGIWTAVTAI